MEVAQTQTVVPTRILYTMLRVSDLDRSLKFYQDVLGMVEQYRETFTEGRFTLVFLGYADALGEALIELTYNWDDGDYTHGSGFGHVALEVQDINAVYNRLVAAGVKVARKPGPMTFAVDETGHREVIAFIEDPDGYRIELIEAR